MFSLKASLKRERAVASNICLEQFKNIEYILMLCKKDTRQK
jgi:hypothetical protein